MVTGLVTSSFLLFIPFYCYSHLCPYNTTYIESGYQCLFLLNEQGNFSQSKVLCEDKNATLWTVSSVENLKDLCNYATPILPQTGYAYFNAEQDVKNKTRYIWPHNNKEVQFPQQYWMDRVPEGLKCLELFIFKDFCKINDIPCWKMSPVVCELLHPNLCDINNGGCEQICIPRGFGSRTCKCETGMKFNETKCVKLKTALEIEQENKCHIGFHYKEDGDLRAGNCLHVVHMMQNLSNHAAFCETLNAVPLTATIRKLEEMCVFIKEIVGESSFRVGIWLYVWITRFGEKFNGEWIYDRKEFSPSLEDLCPNDRSGIISQFDMAFELQGETWCFRSHSRGKRLFGICQAKEKITPCDINNGNCSKYCNLTDGNDVVCTCDPGFEELNRECVLKCKVNNGGCHHFCNYTGDGEVTCSCKPGYTINTTYNTECDIINMCMTDNGGCQHICRTDWYGYIWCECRKGYVLQNDEQACIKPQTIFNSSGQFEKSYTIDDTAYLVLFLFAIVVAIFSISIFCFALHRKRI